MINFTKIRSLISSFKTSLLMILTTMLGNVFSLMMGHRCINKHKSHILIYKVQMHQNHIYFTKMNQLKQLLILKITKTPHFYSNDMHFRKIQ